MAKTGLFEKLKVNESNPRYISDSDFAALKESIRKFPEMLEKRPIIYDDDYVVIGGNMRLRALRDLVNEGFDIKDSYFLSASGWSEEQKREFVIKDNVERGNWDFDVLANEWSDLPLEEWGVSVVWDDDTHEVEDLNYKSTHEVVIECLDEVHQQEVYNKLIQDGYICRILST